MLSCLIIKYLYKILNEVFQEVLFLHGPRFHCHTKGWVLQVCQIGASLYHSTGYCNCLPLRRHTSGSFVIQKFFGFCKLTVEIVHAIIIHIIIHIIMCVCNI